MHVKFMPGRPDCDDCEKPVQVTVMHFIIIRTSLLFCRIRHTSWCSIRPSVIGSVPITDRYVNTHLRPLISI